MVYSAPRSVFKFELFWFLFSVLTILRHIIQLRALLIFFKLQSFRRSTEINVVSKQNEVCFEFFNLIWICVKFKN